MRVFLADKAKERVLNTAPWKSSQDNGEDKIYSEYKWNVAGRKRSRRRMVAGVDSESQWETKVKGGGAEND